ncbi:hypothetical protein GCM10009668_00060 [Nocardioides dubius]|uniref:DUF2771 family protein n=1 Tax=Nocardioides dubius TaxID=317019 RepID=A0ABN1TJ02_9ACTN
MSMALLAAGCGDDAEGQAADDPGNSIVVMRADGSEVEFTSMTTQCVPSVYDESVEVVHAESEAGGLRLMIEVLPEDVEGGWTFDLPADSGSDDEGPKGVVVFVGGPDVEASSDVELATGTVEVVGASCDPVRLEVAIDATLGSEYGGDDAPIRGHVVSVASPTDQGSVGSNTTSR